MSEWEETGKRLDKTLYFDLVMRHEEEAWPLLLDPDYLTDLGPEVTVVLCDVLRLECEFAHATY